VFFGGGAEISKYGHNNTKLGILSKSQDNVSNVSPLWSKKLEIATGSILTASLLLEITYLFNETLTMRST